MTLIMLQVIMLGECLRPLCRVCNFVLCSWSLLFAPIGSITYIRPFCRASLTVKWIDFVKYANKPLPTSDTVPGKSWQQRSSWLSERPETGWQRKQKRTMVTSDRRFSRFCLPPLWENKWPSLSSMNYIIIINLPKRTRLVSMTYLWFGNLYVKLKAFPPSFMCLSLCFLEHWTHTLYHFSFFTCHRFFFAGPWNHQRRTGPNKYVELWISIGDEQSPEVSRW